MRRRCFLLFATLMCGASAAAQSDPKVNALLFWQGSEPDRVYFQDRSAGSTPVERSPGEQFFRIDRPVQSLEDEYRIMVHYDAAEFRYAMPVLARHSAPDFRVHLGPLNGLECNNDDVDALDRLAAQDDVDAVLLANQQAHFLLARQTDSCASFNKDRLRRLIVNSACRLTRLTSFFEMPRLEWPEHADRISRCRRALRSRIGRELFNQSKDHIENGEYAKSDTLLQLLTEKEHDDEWRAGFRAVQIELIDLQHLKIQSLYARTIPLRNAGQLGSAEPYARELARLAEDEQYSAAFDRAGLSERDAKSIYAGIEDKIAVADVAADLNEPN